MWGSCSGGSQAGQGTGFVYSSGQSGHLGRCSYLEALGGWHELSAAALVKLARQLARQTGRLEEEAVRQLRQRLSVKLMQWNAALILSRTPIFAEAEVDGDLDTEF